MTIDKIDYWANVVLGYLSEAQVLIHEGQKELGEALRDYCYDTTPPEILTDVKKRVAERQKGQ